MSQHQFDTFIINDWNLFQSLKTYEQNVDSDVLVFDVETDSVIEKKANLYGIGICWTDQKAFYIPWRNPDTTSFWTKAQEQEIITWLKSTLFKYKIIGHNIIYDTLVLENNLGITIDEQIYCDTILLKHTVDEERPFGLKDVSVSVLGDWADQAQDDLKQEVLLAGGRWVKDEKDMYKASTTTLGKYCCWDVMLTLLLFYHYSKKLQEEELEQFFYVDEVMPLYKNVTINMKRKGVPIDIKYYQNLKQELTQEISSIEQSILNSVKNDVFKFEKNLLNEEFPVKPKGIFPVALCKQLGIPLPTNKKTGAVTLAAKAVQLQAAACPQFKDVYDWILGTGALNPNYVSDIYQAQLSLYAERNNGSTTIFNLSSNDHLGHLIFDVWGHEPLETTKTGKNKLDDDYLETIKSNPVIAQLVDYKKLNKLLSTYVDGILERQIDGIIYTSMLQHGTTSGRYSSTNPNLQNQPRIKDDESGLSELVLKYVNAIRGGFVAGEGNKIVNADYSALEPRCFSHVSGDTNLINVWTKGEDIYSRVAIDVFKVQNVSALKSDPNYLGKIQKEFRQKSKVFTLAVPYGAEESRISQEMGVSYQEARKIIQDYLGAYPGLRKYMATCNINAKNKGKAISQFGRVRHLTEVKTINTLYSDKILDYKYAKSRNLIDVRRTFKHGLNASKNFPIQSLAASIVNRAMIETAKLFKQHNIQGYVALQIHDEIMCVVKESDAEAAAKLLKYAMEESTKISVPLIAEPQIADNWADAK